MSTALMPCNGPMVTLAPDLLSGSSNGRAQARSSPVGVWGHARDRAKTGNFGTEDNDAQEFDATFAESLDARPLSRPAFAPELSGEQGPRKTEGAGKAGCRRTHGPRATKSTRQNHRYRRIIRP